MNQIVGRLHINPCAGGFNVHVEFQKNGQYFDQVMFAGKRFPTRTAADRHIRAHFSNHTFQLDPAKYTIKFNSNMIHTAKGVF